MFLGDKEMSYGGRSIRLGGSNTWDLGLSATYKVKAVLSLCLNVWYEIGRIILASQGQYKTYTQLLRMRALRSGYQGSYPDCIQLCDLGQIPLLP